MDVLTGTSGYAYKEWKGDFYPEDLPDAEMLGYYAGRLPSVEVNNTFYRMPTSKTVGRWKKAVPEDFVFVLKGSRKITHHARLADVEEPMAHVTGTARELGPRLGAHLFQLPPWAKIDVDVLDRFLGLVPDDQRAALEFRHASWFEEEAYEVLRDHDAALVIADGEKVEVPKVSTATWGYLRLRRVDYDEESLGSWARLVREQDWERAFVFFKHENEATGPRLARRFLELVDEES